MKFRRKHDPEPCPRCGRLIRPVGHYGDLAGHKCPHGARCRPCFWRGDVEGAACIECRLRGLDVPAAWRGRRESLGALVVPGTLALVLWACGGSVAVSVQEFFRQAPSVDVPKLRKALVQLIQAAQYLNDAGVKHTVLLPSEMFDLVAEAGGVLGRASFSDGDGWEAQEIRFGAVTLSAFRLKGGRS